MSILSLPHLCQLEDQTLYLFSQLSADRQMRSADTALVLTNN